MAVQALTTIPRTPSRRRTTTTTIANPAPREPNVLVAVISGIHYLEVERTAGGHLARFHFRDGEWFGLAQDVSFDAATAAIAEFIDLTWDLPPGWSQASDDALRAAAAAVLAGPAAALPIAA